MNIGQPERATQDRIIALFRDELHYRYLGDWTDRDGNNRDRDLALKIDEAVKTNRPDGWRGVQARELVVKRALYDVLQNVDEVERIFLIIKQQREY